MEKGKECSENLSLCVWETADLGMPYWLAEPDSKLNSSSKEAERNGIGEGWTAEISKQKQRYGREFPYKFNGNRQSCSSLHTATSQAYAYSHANTNRQSFPSGLYTMTHTPSSSDLLSCTSNYLSAVDILLSAEHIESILTLSDIDPSINSNHNYPTPSLLMPIYQTFQSHLRSLHKHLDTLTNETYPNYIQTWTLSSKSLFQSSSRSSSNISAALTRFERAMVGYHKCTQINGDEMENIKAGRWKFRGLESAYLARKERQGEMKKRAHEARKEVDAIERGWWMWWVFMKGVAGDVEIAGGHVVRMLRRVELWIGVIEEDVRVLMKGIDELIVGIEAHINCERMEQEKWQNKWHEFVLGVDDDRNNRIEGLEKRMKEVDKLQDHLKLVQTELKGMKGMRKEVGRRKVEVERLIGAWREMVVREKIWCFWPGVPDRWMDGGFAGGKGRDGGEGGETIIEWDNTTRDWIEQVELWCQGRGKERGLAEVVRKRVVIFVKEIEEGKVVLEED
ncbi:hypothetical protein EAF00_012012 [Botryotinia globosa]|nr:hypothetical protein EAF00_012012 [Botryotinia globosa]